MSKYRHPTIKETQLLKRVRFTQECFPGICGNCFVHCEDVEYFFTIEVRHLQILALQNVHLRLPECALHGTMHFRCAELAHEERYQGEPVCPKVRYPFNRGHR